MADDHLVFDLVECDVFEEPTPPPPQQQPSQEEPAAAATTVAVVVKPAKTASAKKPKPPPATALCDADTEAVLARLPDRNLPAVADDAVALRFSARDETAGNAPQPPPAGAAGETVVPFPPPPVPPPTEEQRLRNEAARRAKDAERRAKIAAIKDGAKRAKAKAKLRQQSDAEDAAAATAAAADAEAAQSARERLLAEAAADAERQRALERKLRVVACSPCFAVADATIGGKLLTVTFSHRPTKAAAEGEPGWWEPSLSPAPKQPGRWELDGNAFVYKKDTPWELATRFALEFPPAESVVSANDEHLVPPPEDYAFTTPVCAVSGVWPADGAPEIDPESPFVVKFDQPVDADSVAGATTLAVTAPDAKASVSVKLKRVSEAELLARLPHVASPHAENTWVCFAPTERMPHASSARLVVAPGVRSLLGPEPSVQQATASFSVAKKFALKLDTHALPSNCGCTPVSIAFSQPLYHDLAPASVEFQPTITPAVPAGGKWAFDQKDTHTLVYTPGPPGWCNATSYRIDFLSPEPGLRSAFGDALLDPQKGHIFTINTGTPAIRQLHVPSPSRFVSKNVLVPGCPLLVVFDQKVDKDDALAHMRVKCGKARPKLQILDSSAVDKLQERHLLSEGDARVFHEQDAAKCVLLLIDPATPLPPDEQASLRIEPGVRSLEGPVCSAFKQKKAFRTACAFAVSKRPSRIDARSLAPLQVSFTREAAEGSFPAVSPPLPKGGWKLADSGTLEFTPAEPWPGSTEFTLNFSGVRSKFGEAVVPDGFVAAVETSRLGNVRMTMVPYTRESASAPQMPRIPVAFTFNQRIDPAAVLAQMKAKAKRDVPLRQATAAELESLREAGLFRHTGVELPHGEDVLLVAAAAPEGWPWDAKINFSFGEKVPSLEGPLLADLSDLRFSFKVAEEFAVVSVTPQNSAADPLPIGSTSTLCVTFNRELFVGQAPEHPTSVPALEPQHEGEWAYNGPRTLVFTPSAPWAGSTEYHLVLRDEQRRGVASIFDETVALDKGTQRKEFTLAVSPIKTIAIHPVFAFPGVRWITSHAPIFVVFDQRIDHRAAFATVSAKAGSKALQLRLLGQETLTGMISSGVIKRSTLPQAVETLDSSYWIAVAADTDFPFPTETTLTLTVGPNIPSSEGPLLSRVRESLQIEVGPPFKPVSASQLAATPDAPMRNLEIRFSHPLAANPALQFTPEIRPAIEGSWGAVDQADRLVFVPSVHWTNSTAYTVKIAAGATSWLAEATLEDWSYTFETPRTEVVAAFPCEGDANVSTRAMLVLVFSQRVNPERVVPKLSARVSKLMMMSSHKCTFSLVPRADALAWIATQPQAIRERLRATSDPASDGKWFAVVPSVPFPHDTRCSFSVDKEYPSEEGALLAAASFTATFNTCTKFAALEREVRPEQGSVAGEHAEVVVPFNHPINSTHEHGGFSWSGSIVVNPAPPAPLTWTTAVRNGHECIVASPSASWTPSTRYTVTIPAGTVSGFGDALAKPLEFHFSTRTVRLVSIYPHNTHVRSDTPVFLTFDQRVNVANVLRRVKLEEADWGSSKWKPLVGVATQPLDTLDKARDAGVPEGVTAAAEVGTWVAFVLSPALPPKKQIRVVLPPGVPSEEGPLPSVAEESRTFFTLVPFTVCRQNRPKAPGEPLWIVFTQPLLEQEFRTDDPALVELPQSRDGSSFVDAGPAAQRVFSKIRISPEPDPRGDWAILASDPRLAVYMPRMDRWPRASTEYKLSIEAGAVSGLGSVLTENISFSWNTLPLELVGHIPSGDHALLDEPLVLAFNQPVDPATVLPTVRVAILGSKQKQPFCGIALLQGDELAEALAAFAAKSGADVPPRYLAAFKFDRQLPSNAQVKVSIGPNTPALEGPNRTSKPFEFSFSTVPAFRFDLAAWDDATKELTLTFSQPIVATESNLPEWIPEFSPALDCELILQTPDPRMLVCKSGTAGKHLFKGSTSYTVSVPERTRSFWNVLIEGTLAKQVQTPTNAALRILPNGVAPANTLIFIQFSQPFNAAAVAKLIKIKSVHADARVRIPSSHAFEVVSKEAALAAARPRALHWELKEKWPENACWLALRPLSPLPFNSDITVRISKKLPSLEGNLLSAHKAKFSFRTKHALSLVSSSPSSGASVPQGTKFKLSFTERINLSQLANAITISPPLPFRIYSSRMGRYIELTGTAPTPWCNKATKHAVHIDSKSLSDVHGLPLKADVNLDITLMPAPFACALSCPHAPSGAIMTHDPLFGPPAVCVHTKNYTELRVALYKLDPRTDLARWPGATISVDEESKPGAGGVDYLRIGKKLFDEVIPIAGFAKDAELDSWISLAPALENGAGQVGVVILPTRNAHFPNPWNASSVTVLRFWVQCTSLGLDVFHDNGGLTVWVSQLSSGAPVEGASVSWCKPGSAHPFAESKTGADGIAVLGGVAEAGALVLAKHGSSSDSVFLRDTENSVQPEPDKFLWHVFDDRHIYRPNEEVHIKGYVRKASPAQATVTAGGKRVLVPCKRVHLARHVVEVKMVDARSTTIFEGKATTNAWGAFDIAVHLPETANLGEAKAELSLKPPEDSTSQDPDEALDTHTHALVVQEFRRPDFIVDVKPLSEGPHFYLSEDEDGGIVLRVDVKYFSGGTLSDASVEWSVASSLGVYVPPSQSAFSFASDGGHPESWFVCRKTLRGKTLDDGRHHCKVVFRPTEQPPPPVPVFLDATASVLDLSNQTISASARITVHPASLFIGISHHSETDATRTVSIVVCDFGGRPKEGVPIMLAFSKTTGGFELFSGSVQSKVPCLHQELPLDPASPFGDYLLVASILDENERKASKSLRITVSPPPPPPPPSVVPILRRIEPQIQRRDAKKKPSPAKVPEAPHIEEQQLQITATPSGDSGFVDVTLSVPFNTPRAGILCVVGQGILQTMPFAMTGQEHHLRVPMPSDYLPKVHFWASVVGAEGVSSSAASVSSAAVGGGPTRQAYASGSVEYQIPATQKALNVQPHIEEDCVEPGTDTTVTVEVKDAAGRPAVGAEVALIVVDESVLALTKYALPDPIRTFWSNALFGTSSREKHASRKNIALLPWELHKDESSLLSAVSGTTGHTARALSSFTRQSETSRTEAPIDFFDDPLETVSSREERLGNREEEFSIRLIDAETGDPSQWDQLKESFLAAERQGVLILLFNLANLQTFEALLPAIKRASSCNTVLVGTNLDGIVQRQVDIEDALAVARAHDLLYYEVDSVSGKGVLDPLRGIAREVASVWPDMLKFLRVLVLGTLGSGRSTFCTKAHELGTGGAVVDANATTEGCVGPCTVHELRLLVDNLALPVPQMLFRSALEMEEDGLVLEESCEMMREAPKMSKKKKGGMGMPMVQRKKKQAMAQETCCSAMAPQLAMMNMLPPAPCAAPSCSAAPGGGRGMAPPPPPPSAKMARAAPAPRRMASRAAEKECRKMEESCLSGPADELAADIDDASASESADDGDDDKEEEEFGSKAAASALPEEEEEEPQKPLVLRTDFNALANFTPSMPTDANGVARIPVHFPDSITRYRIWAVAVASEGGACGLGESSVVARLPLLVRTTAPRFLSFGDVSTLSVIVQNLTPKDRTVRVAIETTENIEAAEDQGKRCAGLSNQVPAMGRRVFSFTFRCVSPGRATFAVSCVSGAFGDAQHVSVNVYPPPLADAPEIQGQFDGSAAHIPVSPPEGSLPSFGSLEFHISTSNVTGSLGSLASELVACMRKSESSEQICSVGWGLASLLRGAEASGARTAPWLPAPKLVGKTVSGLIKVLKDRQNDAGAFSNWPVTKRSKPSAPTFVVVHIAACAAELKLLGHSVPSKLLDRARNFVQAIAAEDAAGCDFAHSDERAPVIACAIRALHLLWLASPPSSKERSQPPRELAQKFWKAHSPQDLPVEAVAWLLYVLGEAPALPEAAEALEFLKAEGPDALATSFYEPLPRGRVLHSPIRTTAVVLNALSHARKTETCMPLVNELLASMMATSRWASSHEAGWAASAIGEYLVAASSAAGAPDCSVSAWVTSPPDAPMFCGTTPRLVSTASAASQSCLMRLPLSAVPRKPSTELLVGKEGTGRVYWLMRMRFAPSIPDAPALDCGFSVTREYIPQPRQPEGDSDAPSTTSTPDVLFDSSKDMWVVRSGATVTVSVRVSTRMVQYNVAVIDKLPAGFEPILGQEAEAPWCEHTNFRDERSEAFAQELPAGEHVFRFRVRAATIGVYNVAPCRACDMYQPDVFGQCASAKVAVISVD